MKVSHRGDAVEMVVDGTWTAEAQEAVRSGKVDRLVLNHALGFDESSIAFLEGLPLRELVILDPRLRDLEPIHSLGSTLRVLKVDSNPNLRLDLGRLQGLQVLAAAWSQVSATIGAASNLQIAFIRSYQPPDLRPLGALPKLRELQMKDRPKIESLVGLAALPELRLLGIYLAKNLTDIGDLAGRRAIEDLTLEGCRRVTTLEALEGCTGLRRLNVSECGTLASLAPVGGLRGLEQLSLFGSTKIADDDLSPLAGLPKLRQLRMQSRQSYRPSVEDIKASLRAG